jgi:hypothetical protein
MDRRCHSVQVDTISRLRSRTEYLLQQTADKRPQDNTPRTSARANEPSATALLAVLVSSIIAGVVIVALSPKPTTHADIPAPTHLRHLNGGWLIRCDDDF